MWSSRNTHKELSVELPAVASLVDRGPAEAHDHIIRYIMPRYILNNKVAQLESFIAHLSELEMFKDDISLWFFGGGLLLEYYNLKRNKQVVADIENDRDAILKRLYEAANRWSEKFS